MVGAFLYLTACSIRNRVRRRLRRLREPRYVVGLLVGLAYMWFMVFRNMARPGRGPGGADAGAAGAAALAAAAGPVQFLGSLLLFTIAAVAWVWPGAGQPIRFSRAEVQFLFPAPVTRRQLVHYELMRSQLGILFGSAIATLFMRGGSLRSWALLAGIWVVLMAVRLHLMGVALRRTSLARHGASGLARQWLPLAVIVGVVGVLAAAVIGEWPRLAGMATGDEVFRAMQRVGREGAAGAVLWPFRALVRLPMSSGAEFWHALPAALAILAANYAWVLRSDAAFEEASAAQAEKRATDRRAPRAAIKGAAATPFTLAAAGRPETAILWKNLILVGRYVSLRTLVRLLPIILVLALVARGAGGTGLASAVAAGSLLFAGFAVLMGSQMMRNDLRQDLANLALLKTWPLRGAALLRGEVLAPTVVVTAVAWLLLLAAAVFGGGLRFDSPGLAAFAASRLSFLAAAAILAPALILSQVVVQNGLAVLFPAWVTVGASRARGIDAMGQRLLMVAAILLTLVASVLPGTIAALAFAGVVYWLTGTVLIVLPALVVAAVVAGECWLAIEGLGRVFDRTDVTAVDAVE